MTIEQNTLPIEFWDCGDTRCICPEDENEVKARKKFNQFIETGRVVQ